MSSVTLFCSVDCVKRTSSSDVEVSSQQAAIDEWIKQEIVLNSNLLFIIDSLVGRQTDATLLIVHRSTWNFYARSSLPCLVGTYQGGGHHFFPHFIETSGRHSSSRIAWRATKKQPIFSVIHTYIHLPLKLVHSVCCNSVGSILSNRIRIISPSLEIYDRYPNRDGQIHRFALLYSSKKVHVLWAVDIGVRCWLQSSRKVSSSYGLYVCVLVHMLDYANPAQFSALVRVALGLKSRMQSTGVIFYRWGGLCGLANESWDCFGFSPLLKDQSVFCLH